MKGRAPSELAGLSFVVAPVKSPFTYQRIKLVVLSFIFLAAVFSPPSVDPSHKSVIDALAPFEIVADGFREPMGVVVDEEGVVYLSDRKAGKVFEITNGKVETLVRYLDRPVGLAFDPEGQLLIIEGKKGRLLRLNEDGNLTVLAEGMKEPRWVTVWEDGTVYMSAEGLKSKRKSRRHRYNWFSHRWGWKWKDDDDDDDEDEDDDRVNGEVILRLSDGQLSVFAYGFKGLEGLAIDEGSLFAVARRHRDERREHGRHKRRRHGGVFQIPILPDTTAGPISRLSKEEIKKPLGLVIDALGALYVSAERLKLKKKVKDAIGKVAPDGAVTPFARLKDPRGLALDDAGNLYVAVKKLPKNSHHSHKHRKRKRTGGIILFRAPPSPNLDVPAFTNQNPLTVNGTTEPDSRIDVFVNESNSPATKLLTEDGTFSFSVDLVPNTQNLLTVFTTPQNPGLTSAPAEFFTTHDDVAPLITNLQPVNSSFINDDIPFIQAGFSDSLSGINVASVAITLDGFPVTTQAAITESGFTLTPQLPLAEGPHTVSVTVFDLAGNSAFASSTFTVDVTAPAVTSLTPSDGSVIQDATPQIQATFSDNLTGVDIASVTVSLDSSDVTSQATVTDSGFTLDPGILSQGIHTVSVSVSDLAANLTSANWSFTISSGPALDPIGNKTINVGSTLSFTVIGSGGTGPLTFSITPLPLPANAGFNAITGEFSFSPDLSQVGSFMLTFSVSDDTTTTSETITITVPEPPANGVAAFTGRVLDANDFEQGTTTPVVGATVSFLGPGVSTITDGQGNFTLSKLPPGSQVFDIDTSMAIAGPNGATYGGFREEVNLIAGVDNVENRPFFLPRIATNSVTPVNPALLTTVTNSTLGVSLTVPPATAKDENGNDFTGELSISEVPRGLTPAALPDFLDPGLVVTIQPVGVTFSNPVPITFPNVDNLPPGAEVDIWSLNAELGIFEVVGTGLVSGNGTKIETISGGIRATDWHFALPVIRAAIAALSGTAQNSRSSGLGGQCQSTTTSSVCVKDGYNLIDHTIPSYRSLGVSRSITLNYNSSAAFPQPIIPTESVLSPQTALPETFSLNLEVGGVEQGSEIFYEAESQQLRQAINFDGSVFPTGRYPYRVRFESNYTASILSTLIEDFVIIRNEIQSPIGSGWTLNVQETLIENSDGSLLLTKGDGILINFTPVETTPPFANFSPPPGDFSTLVKSVDGTFTRTLKDGTQIDFDASGLKTGETDRNGNTTQFVYDGQGRLIQITDSVGLTTTLTYGPSGKLQSITDPANRITAFAHDPLGNLTNITDPDGGVTSYTYNANHLIRTQTNPRLGISEYNHGPAGRITSVKFPDGTVKNFTPSDTVAFPDLSAGQGTSTNPATAVPLDSVNDAIVDARGNTTSLNTNAFGAVISQTDPLGNVTTIERDINSNPTKITRPNGAELTITYDSLGNLLTSTDSVGATTIFTYEPNFNQVTSITDPKGNLTTINYDANGNPIEIADALGNKTQMNYDSRGLLTSVTSAVGTPEANLTTFTYDAKGNLLTTTDPLMNTTTLVYDSAGNVTKSTDAEERVTEFTYDSINRLISVLDPNNEVTSYSYDAKGNLTDVTDARSQTTAFAYDPMDRLIKATNPLDLIETFTYDANGNLFSTTNRNLQTLTFDYDALNRLVTKIRPPTSTEMGDQETSFTYDSVGNLLNVANPASTVTMQYDLANRLISSSSTFEEDVVGVITVIDSDTVIGEGDTQFDGKSVQVDGVTLTVDGSHTFADLTLVNGAVLTHSPTTNAPQVGRLDIKVTGTLQIDANSRLDLIGLGFLGGGHPDNQFGNKGMTVEFKQGSTGRSGGSYGGLGGANLGSANPTYGVPNDPNDPGSGGAGFVSGAQTAGSGGGLMRIEAQTIQLDGTITADGGDADASAEAGGGSGGGIRIDVGTLQGTGQITANGGNAVFGGGGGGGRVALYYGDASGFDLAKVIALGGIETETGGFFPAGQPGTVFLQQQAFFDPVYTYDLNGNRISMIDPTGQTTYTYDALNRLTSITNNQDLTTTFAYDALGRRTSMNHHNGVVTTYNYDTASQLLDLVHKHNFTTINSFNYSYDKVGNRKTKADDNGTISYNYDVLNRLVESINPVPELPETFVYDAVGNRTDSSENGLSTFNVANQLEDDASFNYVYDANGNLIQKTEKLTPFSTTVYEYDAENKLIRVASLDKTVNYKYDGLGRRIEKEVTETAVTNVTQYIYDQEDILLELDGSNNIVARYTHGPGIDEPLIVEKSGVSSFYHADGLGSITELTDSVGTVAQSYIYSSFGNIESQLDPNFVQPYTFTSREFDPETGLGFYRARTYDFSTGRFLQQDPLGFAGGDLNLYSYVANNPINLTDPKGLVAPVVPAIGACLANPSCAAALGAAAIATGIAAGKLVETVGKAEQLERFTCPGPDPGEFLRLCIGGCKSRFPDSFFRRTLCIATCIVAALSG